MIETTLREAVESALGERVDTAAPLSGGDVATAYRVRLTSGRIVFAKTHADPPEGFFSTEATGLSWLRDSGSVRVPEVLASGDDPPHLVAEWIDTGYPGAGPGTATEAEFGVELAALHRSRFECFGRPDRRNTGSRRLPNEPATGWAEFYATSRLLPLAEMAAAAGALPRAATDALERLAGRLPELLGDPEPPSLLHGDLWAGNRLIDAEGHSWLIDPACFGGHREFDLAMMRLFGGFTPEVERAYGEVYPLQAGYEERVALHQVAPLVVHAIKFAGPYVAAATAAIERYL